jgi:hypothetical protein
LLLLNWSIPNWSNLDLSNRSLISPGFLTPDALVVPLVYLHVLPKRMVKLGIRGSLTDLQKKLQTLGEYP